MLKPLNYDKFIKNTKDYRTKKLLKEESDWLKQLTRSKEDE